MYTSTEGGEYVTLLIPFHGPDRISGGLGITDPNTSCSLSYLFVPKEMDDLLSGTPPSNPPTILE